MLIVSQYKKHWPYLDDIEKSFAIAYGCLPEELYSYFKSKDFPCDVAWYFVQSRLNDIYHKLSTPACFEPVAAGDVPFYSCLQDSGA